METFKASNRKVCAKDFLTLLTLLVTTPAIFMLYSTHT